MEESCAEN